MRTVPSTPDGDESAPYPQHMPAFRTRPILAAAAVALASVPLSAPDAVTRIRPLRLAVGGTAFVTGPGDAPNLCPAPADPCWDYVLDVARGGERLRLGVDHVVVGDVFTVTVTSPDDETVTFTPGESLYSAERLFDSPAAGRWTLRVTAQGVQDERFRLRARLDGPSKRARHVLARPNLQVMPPYEFTFMTPLTNGSTGGAPRGAPASGGPSSCHLEEIVEERAVRCLRMAFGVRNTGQGPMSLRYATGAEGEDRELFQRVFYADEGYVERKAGIARWHATHGHYHHHDAVELRLWRVTDRARGKLEPVGPARRKGFAHRDELLREWTRFYPVWERDGFGLLAGWADYYEWDRPGNFLDFGTSGDGYYLVRMTADPGNGILESNERDNTGYTYFRVSGTTVTALESGRGASPWDRCKIVMPIGAEFAPNVRQPARPRHCPPDTV